MGFLFFWDALYKTRILIVQHFAVLKLFPIVLLELFRPSCLDSRNETSPKEESEEKKLVSPACVYVFHFV